MANLYDYNMSTARKLSYADTSYGHNLHKELEKDKNRKNRDAEIQRIKMNNRKALCRVVGVVVAFIMAFSIVNGYVAINEANNEISSLKAEYNDIVASNQAIQVKIDKAVDLKELQTVAGEKYGMIRPERYQMFYIDLEMNDFSENTRENEKVAKQDKVKVAGVPGIITGTLNIFQ